MVDVAEPELCPLAAGPICLAKIQWTAKPRIVKIIDTRIFERTLELALGESRLPTPGIFSDVKDDINVVFL
ncbi:MAG TPA: hypothetical protein VIO57_12160 [Chloroflexota bacterium]|jgi:hypothetical protein